MKGEKDTDQSADISEGSSNSDAFEPHLDLRGEEVPLGQGTPESPKPVTRDKPLRLEPDTETKRENMRGRLAAGLMVLLAVDIAVAVVMFCAKSDPKSAEVFLDKTLGPLVALVSAATGFYFGSATK